MRRRKAKPIDLMAWFPWLTKEQATKFARDKYWQTLAEGMMLVERSEKMRKRIARKHGK